MRLPGYISTTGGEEDKAAETTVDGMRAPLPSDIHYTFFVL